MDRRAFFKAMPMPLAAGALIVAGKAEATQGFVAQPILRRIRMPIVCDLSMTSVEYAIGEIAAATKSTPLMFRLIVPPQNFYMAKRIEHEMTWRGKQRCGSCIVPVLDHDQRDMNHWSLDADGVMVWSPGV